MSYKGVFLYSISSGDTLGLSFTTLSPIKMDECARLIHDSINVGIKGSLSFTLFKTKFEIYYSLSHPNIKIVFHICRISRQTIFFKCCVPILRAWPFFYVRVVMRI